MLGRLLHGGEETSFILICVEDSSSEVQLLNRFTQNKQTTLILTEPADSIAADNIISLAKSTNFDTDPDSLKKVVGTKFTTKETVLVRSISGLLLLFSPVAVARWLKEIERNCKTLLCVVHRDCVEEGTLDQLIKLPTTVIYIQNNNNNSGTKLCSIVHRKPGGKLQRSQELFSFLPSGDILIQRFSRSKEQEQEELEQEQELANSLTTFKIGTSKADEAAKQGLVLPFYTPQQKGGGEGEVKIGGEKNKIYYEPDSGDDWDDEDPDEDLDF